MKSKNEQLGLNKITHMSNEGFKYLQKNRFLKKYILCSDYIVKIREETIFEIVHWLFDPLAHSHSQFGQSV